MDLHTNLNAIRKPECSIKGEFNSNSSQRDFDDYSQKVCLIFIWLSPRWIGTTKDL